MRWQNVRDFLGFNRSSARDEVKEVEPRTLSERESGWIHDVLQANLDWRDTDFSRTRVVAEGPNAEGYSIVLQTPKLENSTSKSRHHLVGQLWIETEDRFTVNIQLLQWEGQLGELYVLCIDSKGRTQSLLATWNEVSREAVSG